jgi:hypothetical protein
MSDITQHVDPDALALLAGDYPVIEEADVDGTPVEFYDQGGEHDGEHVETPTVKRGDR